METLLRQVEDMQDADPKMEEVLKKITMLQKDQEQTEADKKELDKEVAAAQSELQKLYAEKAALKEEVMKKQETIRILKLQRDNQLKKEKKQQEQAEETKKRIDDLTTKIQEEKMKQRKQRLEFQEQMEDLMEKHKSLAKFYVRRRQDKNAKRLGAEIDQIKEQKKELLQQEKEKLAKLKELEETEAKLREEGVLTSENLFLCSEQATYAIKIFEEENKHAKLMLEEVVVRQTEALNKYNTLKSQLGDAEGKLPKVPQAPLDEPQLEISKESKSLKAAMGMNMEDMDHQKQERGGPVEDDEMKHSGAGRRIAEEHDDPTELFSSIGPLVSCEYSSTSLQISSSILPTLTDFRWSAAVLSAFDNLPALSTEEVKTLYSFLGSSLTSQPAGVKEFLVTFQSHPDHCNHLRKLAQQLKSLGREDIVKAMHQEKAALRWLGPVLPEEHLIRDILPSLWVQLTVKLSLFHPKGYDWKWLAERLSIPRDFIDLWKQGEVPADNVLKTWQVKVSEATVGRLFDLLIEQREDLAAML